MSGGGGGGGGGRSEEIVDVPMANDGDSSSTDYVSGPLAPQSRDPTRRRDPENENRDHHHGAATTTTTITTTATTTFGAGSWSNTSVSASSLPLTTRVPGREDVLRRLSQTLIRGTLTSVDLSQRGVTSQDAPLIRAALSRNPRLSTLKLSYNGLRDDGVAELALAVRGHPALRVLDVGFNGVGDAGCEALAAAIAGARGALEVLCLSGNSVGARGATALATAAATPTASSLRRLHLTANGLGPSGARALAQAAAARDARAAAATGEARDDGSGLTELFLGGTGMGSAGCLSVSNMLLTNFSIRTLVLSDNGLTDRDLVLFSQSVSRNRSVPLEVLQLSFNSLTCAGVECLMNALWGSSTLRELRLDNNRVGDRGAQLVAVVSSSSASLREVDLGFNALTAVGVRALSRSLAEDGSTLETLVLSGNPLDTAASKTVSYALAHNSRLRTLLMDNCSIGYAAQRHIAAGVASNSSSALRRITGFVLGPITVTLGLPNVLESWTNDQVLSFLRYMWDGQRRQRLASTSPKVVSSTKDSCVSLPGRAATGRDEPEDSARSVGGTVASSNGRRGPRDPATVVAAAEAAAAILGARSPPTSARRSRRQSPLTPIDEIVLETTPEGQVRPPPWEGAMEEDEDDEAVVATETNGDVTHHHHNHNGDHRRTVDPVRRERIRTWLKPHLLEIDRVSQQPFDQADLWRLHQHFFSPVTTHPVTRQQCSCDPASRSMTLSPTSLSSSSSPNHRSNEPLSSMIRKPSSSLLRRRSSCQRLDLAVRSPEEATVAPAPTSIPPPAPTTTTSLRGGRGPIANGGGPRPTRPRSESIHDADHNGVGARGAGDDDGYSPRQPASKRPKNARIAFYPHVRAALESLSRRNDDDDGGRRRVLILLRRLKYVEDALLVRNDDILTAADVEAALMDLS